MIDALNWVLERDGIHSGSTALFNDMVETVKEGIAADQAKVVRDRSIRIYFVPKTLCLK
jgi:hypothetical protein